MLELHANLSSLVLDAVLPAVADTDISHKIGTDADGSCDAVLSQNENLSKGICRTTGPS